MTFSATPKREKRRGLILFQLFIIVGFLAVVWFSFGQNVLAPQKQLGVPERVGRWQWNMRWVKRGAMVLAALLPATTFFLTT